MADKGGMMKTLRFDLPTLADADADDLLESVARIEGVVAALVEGKRARLAVVMRSGACQLLVEHGVVEAVLVATPAQAIAA